MSDGGLVVLDGTHLSSLSPALPDSDGAVTGAHVLEIADGLASEALLGLSLPERFKSSALSAAISGADDVTFRRTELDRERACKVLEDYISAIADELKDDPLVVSVLDGRTLGTFLEDEDDFAMLAENLFTELDTEDKGKVCKDEIRNALVHMGVDMGIPPFSEFPLLNDILKKHGAEGEEELGQAQFAELLQPILQDIADALTKKQVIVMQKIKVVNGSKLRKLLADEKWLNKAIEKISQENHSKQDELVKADLVRGFLEENGEDFGLPPAKSDEAVSLLYDVVFSDAEGAATQAKDEFRECVKSILEKFAEQLEVNPVYYDPTN